MTDSDKQIKRLETAINALAKRIAFLERENKRIRSELQQQSTNKG
jgi:chaperonin cofactor prefoldin